MRTMPQDDKQAKPRYLVTELDVAAMRRAFESTPPGRHLTERQFLAAAQALADRWCVDPQ
ncbi:hypothetical protein VPH49_22090 [Pseudomonas luteola]|uniref:hypothetical protein n=1 Tax=Pseudomonas luteola TaxID=47886 RepID=UPI003A8C768C